MFVRLQFFLWPLCCLFFFDKRILIAPLLSSNSSSCCHCCINSKAEVMVISLKTLYINIQLMVLKEYVLRCWRKCVKIGKSRGLSYVQWFKPRGDCWFRWYCWNCWPSLFNISFHKVIITLLPFFIERLQYDWLWSGHIIIKEMFYITIKLKPELARASMTTSDVNNQWRSNFQQQII